MVKQLNSAKIDVLVGESVLLRSISVHSAENRLREQYIRQILSHMVAARPRAEPSPLLPDYSSWTDS